MMWNAHIGTAHFKEPGLHNCQEHIRKRMRSHVWKRVRHVSQAWLFNLSTLHLKAAGPRAAAHMSLHTSSQCQRAARHKNRTRSDPRLLDRGTLCPSMLATERFALPRRRRCGEGASSGRFDSGQHPFCNFIAATRKSMDFRACPRQQRGVKPSSLWPVQA